MAINWKMFEHPPPEAPKSFEELCSWTLYYRRARALQLSLLVIIVCALLDTAFFFLNRKSIGMQLLSFAGDVSIILGLVWGYYYLTKYRVLKGLYGNWENERTYLCKVLVHHQMIAGTPGPLSREASEERRAILVATLMEQSADTPR